jgi:4-amino-4-deoxy-L-arabinose transferase-like glycosyltransferase
MRMEALLVALITGLGGILRFAWFTGRGLNVPDESTYWFLSSRLLDRDLTSDRFARPLHTSIQAASSAVFGRNEWAIRIPEALFGTLTIPAVYLVTRKLFGRRAAAFAALALAVSWQAVLNSRSALAAADALFFLVVGALVYLYARSARGTSMGLLFLSGALFGTAVLCHPATIYFVLPITLVELAASSHIPGWRGRLLAWLALLGGLITPGWLYEVALAKLNYTPGWSTPGLTYYELVLYYQRYVSGASGGLTHSGPWIYLRYLDLLARDGLRWALLLVGAAASVWRSWTNRAPQAALPALQWGIPLVLWSWVIAMLAIDRNVYSALGAQCVLIGLGAAETVAFLERRLSGAHRVPWLIAATVALLLPLGFLRVEYAANAARAWREPASLLSAAVAAALIALWVEKRRDARRASAFRSARVFVLTAAAALIVAPEVSYLLAFAFPFPFRRTVAMGGVTSPALTALVVGLSPAYLRRLGDYTSEGLPPVRRLLVLAPPLLIAAAFDFAIRRACRGLPAPLIGALAGCCIAAVLSFAIFLRPTNPASRKLVLGSLVFALSWIVFAPSWQTAEDIILTKRSVISKAIQISHGKRVVYFPAKHAAVLARQVGGPRASVLQASAFAVADSRQQLLALDPRPQLAIYYNSRFVLSDWIGSELHLAPVLTGITEDGDHEVKVYDLRPFWSTVAKGS